MGGGKEQYIVADKWICALLFDFMDKLHVNSIYKIRNLNIGEMETFYKKLSIN